MRHLQGREPQQRPPPDLLSRAALLLSIPVMTCAEHVQLHVVDMTCVDMLCVDIQFKVHILL